MRLKLTILGNETHIFVIKKKIEAIFAQACSIHFCTDHLKNGII